jgi:D-sedoheptulose 7-phosphate isomerase
MRSLSLAYYENLKQLIERMTTTNLKDERMDCHSGDAEAIRPVTVDAKAGCKLIFIGNGTSAAISDHMSTDYWKNGRIRAVAFSDPALLTCIGNTCGCERLFAAREGGSKVILHFHVPCERYGPVEILLHSLCRCILDAILDGRSC